jgi:hypothetical protein
MGVNDLRQMVTFTAKPLIREPSVSEFATHIEKFRKVNNKVLIKF